MINGLFSPAWQRSPRDECEGTCPQAEFRIFHNLLKAGLDRGPVWPDCTRHRRFFLALSQGDFQ